MGSGFSRRKKLQQLQKNGNQVNNADNQMEVKDEEQLNKEFEELNKQKALDKSSALFIGNQDEFERDGKKRNLTFLNIEEQKRKKKQDQNKQVNAVEELLDDRDAFKKSEGVLKKQYPFPPEDAISVSKSKISRSSAITAAVTKEPIKKERNSITIKTAIKEPEAKNRVQFKLSQTQSQKELTDTKVPKFVTLQQLREDVSLDLSRELQGFGSEKNKLPDFSCDISAIYANEDAETPQQQAARIKSKMKKIQQEKEKEKQEKQEQTNQQLEDVPLLLNWPKQGECKIMSVSFKVVYSNKDLDLKMLKSYDFHTASSLAWKWNSSLSTYDFILQDNHIFDASNTSTTHLQNNLISFVVAKDGQFICIKDEQDFVAKVRKTQSVINSRNESTQTGRRSRNKTQNNTQTLEKNKVIEETENAMKQQIILFDLSQIKEYSFEFRMWVRSVTDFLGKKSGGRNESQADAAAKSFKKEMVSPIVHNRYNCTLVQKAEVQPREKLENFLKSNLTSNEKYFNFCFKNPKKTIRDKLKVWEVVEENQKEVEFMPNKYRFPVLRKHEIQTGIIEDKGTYQRPHTIINDSCKIIVIDHKRDLFVDVEQELRLLVFLWPERGDNQNEIHFYEELSKFKDMCDEALKSMVLDLSRVRALPISYKPKLKKKYFELY